MLARHLKSQFTMMPSEAKRIMRRICSNCLMAGSPCWLVCSCSPLRSRLRPCRRERSQDLAADKLSVAAVHLRPCRTVTGVRGQHSSPAIRWPQELSWACIPRKTYQKRHTLHKHICSHVAIALLVALFTGWTAAAVRCRCATAFGPGFVIRNEVGEWSLADDPTQTRITS